MIPDWLDTVDVEILQLLAERQQRWTRTPRPHAYASLAAAGLVVIDVASSSVAVTPAGRRAAVMLRHQLRDAPMAAFDELLARLRSMH